MLIGTDRNIFTASSVVRRRIVLLATTHFDSVTSIVFSARSHKISQKIEDGNFHAYPTSSRSRLLYGWDAFSIARRLERPDIVSAQDPFETGLVALFISRLYGVPLAVEVHTDFLAPSYRRHLLLNKARVVIAGYVLKRAAGGYAVSQKMKDSIVKHYNLKVPFSVLPIYIDLSRFEEIAQKKESEYGARTKLENDERILLWVGRMEPEKNPVLALEAFIQARQKGHNIRLIFVGSGSLLEAVKRKVAEARLTEYVEFTETFVDPVPFYAKADLLLVTSEYEGYGMVVVEALAAKVPVLSTDVGIAREAGADIVSGDFATALDNWLVREPKAVRLQLRSYSNEEEYLLKVAKCYEDIACQSTL